MRRLRRFSAIAAWCLCGIPAGPAGEVEDLRHCGVRPDSLDYVLMSIVNPSAPRAVLSFNHRDGTTHLVREGETIGPYTVLSYKQHTKRVFDPSVSALRTETEATARLKLVDGTTFEVRQGVRHPVPGLLATLVSLESGACRHVREGDTICLVDGWLEVTGVGEEEVRARVSGREVAIPLLTDEESTALAERYRARQAALAAQAKAAPDAAEAEPPPAAKNDEAWWRNAVPPLHYAPPPSSGTGIQFGTEYRYPVAWEVLPLRTLRNGKVVIAPLAVPTEFETRHVTYGGIGAGTMRFPKPVPAY